MQNHIILMALLLSSYAIAQSHDHHHASYQNWMNWRNQGCCNNQDCRELSDNHQRSVSGKLEVYVHGEWCPVMPHHYLKRGNAPNWTTAHICITAIYGSATLCEQFICYQPKPLT